MKSEFLFCNSVGGPLARQPDEPRVVSRVEAGRHPRAEALPNPAHVRLVGAVGRRGIGWVARQLGHANTDMVIHHCYRWVRNNTRQDGSAFDKAAAQVGL